MDGTVEVSARLSGETSKGTKKFDLDQSSGLSGTIYCPSDKFTSLGSPNELVINVGIPTPEGSSS